MSHSDTQIKKETQAEQIGLKKTTTLHKSPNAPRQTYNILDRLYLILINNQIEIQQKFAEGGESLPYPILLMILIHHIFNKLKISIKNNFSLNMVSRVSFGLIKNQSSTLRFHFLTMGKTKPSL